MLARKSVWCYLNNTDSQSRERFHHTQGKEMKTLGQSSTFINKSQLKDRKNKTLPNQVNNSEEQSFKVFFISN